MDRSRNTSYTIYEIRAAELINRHDWSITQQTAEIYSISHLHTHNRDDADGSSLLDRKSVV